MIKKYNFNEKIVTRKFVDLFEMKNCVSQYFSVFRIFWQENGISDF